MPFLQAFGDVVMAEVHRLEAQKSDRQKMDFISSISHELRSPLHGILGTVECLQDELTDGSTLDLVSQVEACGRTLLDIVNHLLDHSKINYYSRDVKKSLRNAQRSRSGKSSPQLGSTESLDAVVSLDALTEEVVDTTYYSFCCSKDRKMVLDRQVAIVLDIDRQLGVDWHCRIAVGGWKRIIINLVSNALKYTDTGYIHISLKAAPGDVVGSFHAVLTVRDSGCGMSKAFLRDKLFMPFAQEDSLMEGTGLGMSLVATIVKALGGKIEVQSKQDVGTTVTAMIPLEKSRDRIPSSGSVHASPASSTPKGLSISLPIMKDSKSEDPTGQDTAQALLVESVTKLCTQMDISTIDLNKRDSERADIDISFGDGMDRLDSLSSLSLNGSALPEIEHSDAVTARKPLIVICKDAISAREFKRAHFDLVRHRHVEIIAQPVGPERLYKAVRACLARATTGFAVDLKENDTPSPALASGELYMTASPSSAPTAPQPLSTKDNPPHRPAGNVTGPDQRRPSLLPNRKSSQKAVAPSGLTLLLVEDNSINLQLLSTYASRQGHGQINAHNGQQAVDAYKAACLGQPLPSHLTAIQSSDVENVARTPDKPRVILMDISMPVLNGFEATRQIRHFEQSHDLKPAKVIALTGLGSASAQQEAYSSGIDLYLTKPVRLKELSKILDSIRPG